MGSGRTELALSLFGNPDGYRIDGELVVKGKLRNFNHPKDAIDAGLAYVTEDRKGDGSDPDPGYQTEYHPGQFESHCSSKRG